jgi:AcrR family transcriptional regulator
VGRPAQIHRADIVRAATDLADEGGLGTVTMHAAATRLGVSTMALYRHVRNKADLLDGVVEHLLSEIALPDPDLPWQVRLSSMAESLRRTARRHPGAFPLLLQLPADTPGARRVRQAVYEALGEAGVPPEQLVRVERLLSTVVLGFAVSETAGRFTHGRATSDADFALLEELMADLLGRMAEERPRGAAPSEPSGT